MKFSLPPGHSLIREVLTSLGWSQTAGTDWQLRWATDHPPQEVFDQLQTGQRINLFPDSRALTNKCLLHDTLSKARRLFSGSHPNPIEFAPPGYVLPQDYAALLRAGAAEPEAIWIAKPAASSGGRGIQLHADVANIECAANVIVQRYLASPHLLEGRKYTLRFYVLVTSLDPLIAYLHREGLAKLATRPFDPDPQSVDDHFIHLTNPDVLKSDAQARDIKRMSHSLYRQQLRLLGLDDELLWARIQELIRLTLISAQGSMLAGAARSGFDTSGSFQLFGLDILVDELLRPWLLECNFGPSLEIDAKAESEWAELEREVKSRVVTDTVQLVFGGQDPAGNVVTALDDPPAALERAKTQVMTESSRLGGFERIAPGEDMAQLLCSHPAPRHLDWAFAEELCVDTPPARPPLVSVDTTHYAIDDHLLLVSTNHAQLRLLNATAAYLWLCCADGMTAQDIMSEMQTYEPDEMRLSNTVRNTLATWVEEGLLVPRLPEADLASEAPDTAGQQVESISKDKRCVERSYHCLGWAFRISGQTESVLQQLESWSGHHFEKLAELRGDAIYVLDLPGGYQLCTEDGLSRNFDSVRVLSAFLLDYVYRKALEAIDCQAVFPGTIVRTERGAIVVVSGQSGVDHSALVRAAADFDLQPCTSIGLFADQQGLFWADTPSTHAVGQRVSAVVVVNPASKAGSVPTRITSALLLEALLRSHSDAWIGLHNKSIAKFIHGLLSTPCFELRSASPEDLKKGIEQLVAAPE